MMAIDIQTIKDGKIARTFHMENWQSALQNSAPNNHAKTALKNTNPKAPTSPGLLVSGRVANVRFGSKRTCASWYWHGLARLRKNGIERSKPVPTARPEITLRALAKPRRCVQQTHQRHWSRIARLINTIFSKTFSTASACGVRPGHSLAFRYFCTADCCLTTRYETAPHSRTKAALYRQLRL